MPCKSNCKRWICDTCYRHLKYIRLCDMNGYMHSPPKECKYYVNEKKYLKSKKSFNKKMLQDMVF